MMLINVNIRAFRQKFSPSVIYYNIMLTGRWVFDVSSIVSRFCKLPDRKFMMELYHQFQLNKLLKLHPTASDATFGRKD